MPTLTPRARFQRIAVGRANLAIKALKRLSKCSAKRYYEYSQEDVNLIFGKIEQALVSARNSFNVKSGDEFEQIESLQ